MFLVALISAMLALPLYTGEEPEKQVPAVGISTNIPYDITWVPGYGVTSIPSVSMEFYPTQWRRVTLGADVEFPMWKNWDTHRFMQINNLTFWARRYFFAHAREVFEVVVYERDALPVLPQPLLRRSQRGGIAVDADEATGHQAARDFQRVSRSAERPVQVDPVRANMQALHALPQQNGRMCELHQNPRSSNAESRFSGVSCSDSRLS